MFVFVNLETVRVLVMMNIDEVLDELQQCSSILLNFDLTARREKMVMCLCDVASDY